MNVWHKALTACCLVFILILAACGNTSNQPSTNKEESNSEQQTPAETTPSTASPSTDNSQPATRVVNTVNGEITIPVNPKRIVAEEYLGSLIPLELIPIGAPGLALKNVYFKEALQGVADTGDYGKMNAEKIISLEPDLILSANNDNFEQLNKIAPTIVIPWGDLKNAHDELTFFGELFGKQQEAADWLKDYDERIAAAKARVDKAISADASFSILEMTEKSIYVYGDNFGRGGQPVYQALGRKPPEIATLDIMEKQWAEISEEMLPEFAGDYLVITSDSRTLEDLKKDPMWGSLPAIKNDKVYIWKEEISWYYDPVAVLSQTEELANWLAPETK